MQPDVLGKRLREVLGADAPKSFDPEDETLVEAVARLLLVRFHRENHYPTFELLVEATAPIMKREAMGVTRRVGLAVDPAQLVSNCLGRMYVDVRQPSPICQDFLAEVRASMEADARALVEKLARTAHIDGVLEAARETDPTAGIATSFSSIVSFAFHRLTLEDRRLLLARDVDNLPYEQIAEMFGIYQDEIEERLLRARGRLSKRIANVFMASTLEDDFEDEDDEDQGPHPPHGPRPPHEGGLR